MILQEMMWLLQHQLGDVITVTFLAVCALGVYFGLPLFFLDTYSTRDSHWKQYWMHFAKMNVTIFVVIAGCLVAVMLVTFLCSVFVFNLPQ